MTVERTTEHGPLPDSPPAGSASPDDVQSLPSTLLDEITDLVETARAMPMSASCVVNRAEVLALLDQLRSGLPPALAQASAVLAERDTVIAEAHVEAERIRAAAEHERIRRLSQHEIVVQAQAEAARLTEEARYQADAMRMEVEDYVDAKLANFEIVLNKTLSAVARGRDKLSGRHDLDALGDEGDDRPLP